MTRKKRSFFFIFCLWFPFLGFSQQNEISGVVRDAMDAPFPGVSVQVLGTNLGVMTNGEGRFTINASNTDSLVFSSVGYRTQTLFVGNNSTFSVTMKPNEGGLEEVIVIGYGSVRKRDLTGAVTSIKNEDVTISPTNNVMEALQGRVPGMDITRTTGRVGGDVQILLRGSRSIYGSNEPLFIIDGTPGSYSQINPLDIASIDILKDASSTAIYGSAGANGVVIITTKRGKEGKVDVNFDAFYGFNGKPNFLHGMIGEEWADYHREAYKYINGSYPADMSALFGNQDYLKAYNEGKWIDWIDEVSGNSATIQKYSLSLTAGSRKTKVYTSAYYSRETGLLANEELNKFALRLNIDHEVNKWSKVGFTSNVAYQERDAGVNNTFTKALTAFPLGDVYDEKGNIKYEYISNQYTPMGDFIPDQFVNNTRSLNAYANAYIELSPFDGLTLRTQAGASLNSSRLGQYWGARATALRPSYAGSPHASITNSRPSSYTWENILSYNTSFGNDHTFGGSFITSWTKGQDESNMAAGSGQLVDRWSFRRLASAVSQHVESDFSQYQKLGYAMRLNYSYLDKYLLSFSNRWDGVSWFVNKWDMFPSGAFAWRVSDEDFMIRAGSWLNDLKLRVSYGVTGNSGGTGAYVTKTQAYLYTANGVSINGEIVPFSQYTGTFGGSDLGWEKSKNWNIGLDYAVLNNRLNGSIDWFDTKTEGLLFKRTLPITSGLTGWGSPLATWQNLAETSNRGIEALINSRNIQSSVFSWNSTLSFTWSKERIDKLPTGDLLNESLFEGYPIRSFYGYKYLGIWGTDVSKDLLAEYGVEPGFIKVETKEKDGDGGVHKYGESDRQVLGHLNPNWIIGLNNTINYEGFDLSIFAMARYGQTISSDLLGRYTAKESVTENQIAGTDYWTENNQNAFYPRPGSASKQSTVYSALRFRDGSFIKIKNVTLGYSFPKSFSSLINNIRVYATAYNPVIFVKDDLLKGTDPETNGADSFPTYKQFVFGVNIGL